MNALFPSFLLTVGAGQLHSLLVAFLVLVFVLAVVGGLIYCIERFVNPIPAPVKMVIALVLVLLVVIWAVGQFAPGVL